jgi:hypothetical protein
MNPILKNILAVIAGVLIGGLVNMGIVMLGPSIIAPPEGADVTTMEGLKASMHLFAPINFLMPFLAHAIGTFVGAFIVAVLATTRKMWYALGVGAWFLLGGVINVIMLPSPVWFTVVDLAGAYLPMGYFAGKLATRQRVVPEMTMETK